MSFPFYRDSKMQMKEPILKRKESLLILLFFALILFWFHDVIFYENIFSDSDLGRYFYPLRHFAVNSMKGGDVPLWNPYIHVGKPLLATLQTCVFYPVSIIYYIIPAFDDAFDWYIIFHFILAGIFMYILMRYWKHSRTAASVSSVVFVFGGYLSSVISLNTSLSSVVWLPIIVLFFDKALRTKRPFYAVVASIFMAIQFLGGEPTMIYCTTWLIFFYLLGFIYTSRSRECGPKGVLMLFGLFVITAGLWVLISAIQLLPFIELLSKSTRAGVNDFNTITTWSLSPPELLAFFIPYVLGNISIPAAYLDTQQWMTNFYLGIIPFFFILFAFISRPSKKAKFFGILTVLFLILALGRYTPMYKILHDYIFGFGHIRYPIRFIFVAIFSISILAGMGYDAFVKIWDDERKKTITKWIVVLNGLLGILLISFLKFQEPIYRFIVSSRILIDKITLINLEKLFNVFLFDSAHICRFFIAFTLAAMVIILYLNRKIGKGIFGFLIVALVFIDLYSVNTRIADIVNNEIFKHEPPGYSLLKRDKSLFRITRTGPIQTLNKSVWGDNYDLAQYYRKATFYTNAPMIYGIYDADGYGSLFRKDRYDFMELIFNAEYPTRSKLINLLNIKYMISAEPLRAGHYEMIFKDKVDRIPVFKDGKVYTYYYISKNNACMDRAFLVREARVAGDREEALEILGEEGFDPAELVVLEEEPKSFDKKSGLNIKESVKIVSYKPKEVIIEASCKEPKFLILSDSYYPGWKVFVDGKDDKLYRAYYFLRAVHLDSGKHVVKFVFDPLSYKIGKIISLITITFLALFLLRFALL